MLYRAGLITASCLLAVPLISSAWSAWASFALAQALAALGIAVLLRAGQISFGHAFYFALGGYAVAFASRAATTDALALLLVGAVAAGVVAAVLAPFITRYRGIFFAMLNLTGSMLAYTLLQKAYDFAGGSDGLRVGQPTLFALDLSPTQFSVVLYGIALALLLAAIGLISRYLRSPMGESLSALKANETRIDYLGLSPNVILSVAYVISALLAGLGGALSALNTGIVTPDLTYWTRSAEFVFIAVLGGIGSVVGPVLGAFAFEGIKLVAASYLANAWDIVLGIILMVIVLYCPSGIAGIRAMLRRASSGEVVR